VRHTRRRVGQRGGWWLDQGVARQYVMEAACWRSPVSGKRFSAYHLTVADNANKTTATDSDVGAFLDGIGDDQRRRDAKALVEVMSEVTGQPAVLWGPSIVGFGSHHYRYATGREGDMPAIGFAPRAAQTVLYLFGGMEPYAHLLERLGPHKTGKGCLYVKRVDQADADALREIIALSYRLGSS
jgi:hypothetical protein